MSEEIICPVCGKSTEINEEVFLAQEIVKNALGNSWKDVVKNKKVLNLRDYLLMYDVFHLSVPIECPKCENIFGVFFEAYRSEMSPYPEERMEKGWSWDKFVGSIDVVKQVHLECDNEHQRLSSIMAKIVRRTIFLHGN